MIERRWGPSLKAGNAPFQFGPAEGTAFFAPLAPEPNCPRETRGGSLRLWPPGLGALGECHGPPGSPRVYTLAPKRGDRRNRDHRPDSVPHGLLSYSGPLNGYDVPEVVRDPRRSPARRVAPGGRANHGAAHHSRAGSGPDGRRPWRVRPGLGGG